MGKKMSTDVEKQLDDEVLRWVTFELDKETYCISVSDVREVLRYTEIAPVPGSPDYVLGIINLRGNVVTVIETRKRFGLASVEVDDVSRIVIVEIDGHEVGILVDSVAEVVDLRQSMIEAAPNVGNDDTARYIQGVTSRDGKLLIILDLNKMLSSEELNDIDSF